MATLLQTLFGRLPIGWLQLVHNRTRMAAAIAGVAFANVLVFVQLGMLGALEETIVASYAPLRADIIVAPDDAETLTDGSQVARSAVWRVLAVPGVAAAAPLHVAKLDFTRPDGAIASLQVYGIAPEAEAFVAPAMQDDLARLRLRDTALLDVATRGLDPQALRTIGPERPYAFEVNGLTLSAIGTITLGGGFTADGALVVSDQTFLRLYGQRISGAPSRVLLRVEPGADVAQVARAVAAQLAGEPVVVQTLDAAIEADLSYQTTQRPVGLIFGFGTAIGVLVGIVIVYQVLSTDVADHLREYATLKAMGYGHPFFLGIVFEEALVLGILGFLPGFAFAAGIYAVMAQATGLPVEMTALRAFAVFFGTIAACAISGAIATRRLAGADPAELF